MKWRLKSPPEAHKLKPGRESGCWSKLGLWVLTESVTVHEVGSMCIYARPLSALLG